MNRKIWKNSRHESVASDGTVYYLDAPCVVSIDEGSIEIRYEDADGDMVNYVCTDPDAIPLCFEGKKVRIGERVGDARLRMLDGGFMEGEWHEGAKVGDWYITLG
jgi:hypothetical protein